MFLDVLWFGCSVVGCSVVWVFSSLGVQWFGCSVVWVFSGLGLTWFGCSVVGCSVVGCSVVGRSVGDPVGGSTMRWARQL